MHQMVAKVVFQYFNKKDHLSFIRCEGVQTYVHLSTTILGHEDCTEQCGLHDVGVLFVF